MNDNKPGENKCIGCGGPLTDRLCTNQHCALCDVKHPQHGWPTESEQRGKSWDAEMPGAWRCPKCSFTLQKNVIHAGNGSISADTSPVNEVCPNDGVLMRPLTWRVVNEELFQQVVSLQAENVRRIRHLNRLATWAQQDPTGPWHKSDIQEWVLNEIRSALGEENPVTPWQPETISKDSQIHSLQSRLTECSDKLNREIEGHDFQCREVESLQSQLAEAKDRLRNAADALSSSGRDLEASGIYKFLNPTKDK